MRSVSFNLSDRMSVSTLPFIQAQVVLDQTTLFAVWRLVRGLLHSHQRAVQSGTAGPLVIRFADRSPQRRLSTAEFDGLRAITDEAGVEIAATLHRPGADVSAIHAELTADAPAEVDWVLWLDPDAYPGPRSIGALLAAATDGETAGVEARTVPFDARKPVDPNAGTTPWFSLAATLLRRAAFEAVGGFSPDVAEDGTAVDLSWRLRAAGWRLAYAPQAAVFVDRAVQLDPSPDTPLTPLTSLTLAHRFLDQSAARQLRETFEASPDDAEREAAGTIAELVAAGTLSQKVPNAKGIAMLTASGQLVSRY